MVLQELKIEIERWGENKGQYKGAAKFGDERGEVSLNLSNDHINQIFSVCANGIIETAKRAASDMTCNIIEQAGIEQAEVAEDARPPTLSSRLRRALTRTPEQPE